MDISVLQNVLRSIIGDITFKEAYPPIPTLPHTDILLVFMRLYVVNIYTACSSVYVFGIVLLPLDRRRFEKTGRILNVTVAPQHRYETPRLLNYVTAPDVVRFQLCIQITYQM
jgi:hypothetical protein